MSKPALPHTPDATPAADPVATPAAGPVPLARIGLGAANLGNLFRELDEEEARAILEAAWEGGVRHFDTAPHYGLGLSERRLGAFLATRPREEFFLSTKVGRLLEPIPGAPEGLDLDNGFHVPLSHRRVWDMSAAGLERSLDESLERLGLDRVDAVYLHDPERTGDPNVLATAIPGLRELRERGRVRAVGIGSMDPRCLEDALRLGGLDLAMVAGRLTLADQSALPGVVEAAERTGARLVIASVFNSGLLSQARPAEDAVFDYDRVDPAMLARVRRIADVCAAHGVELPAAALAYPRRFAPVDTVVVGASAPGQIRESLRRDAASIPEELWRDLAAEALIP